ncbi:SDR family NAD(P)-dependent oxidoreductase [Bauldia sp.]|uniref:SDR family NAD(P)-dependent oxidoreductase n=1 Tax=Bauldia sp. TaxID=2575872 RepID=UPI003BA9F4BF
MTLDYTTALVIGGSRGTGRQIAKRLAEHGVRTVVVARNQKDLDDLKREVPAIDVVAADATTDGTAERLLAEVKPDLLVLAGGHMPKMAALSELTWDEFSRTWNVDTRIAFAFVKAALQAPMPKGSTIVSFASGAALGGSPLSGGYAGAKRMQHFVSNYGAWEADQRDLGLAFYTIYPKQFIAGTQIAENGAGAYGAARSISAEEFMKTWDTPLTPGRIGDEVIGLLATRGDPGAYGITGSAMEKMA